VEYVTLGTSDLKVSRIAFGCEPLGGVDWGAVDPGEVARAVHYAWDHGVTLFDTADVYGLGQSEQRLADALGEHRKDALIATKFGVSWRPAEGGGRATTWRDASPENVVRCLEGSLRRLRVDRVALYQIHWPDPRTPIDATLEALERCLRAGKVQCVGACNFPAQAIREMHAVLPLTSIQLPMSLIEPRTSAPAFETCAAIGIGTLAYGCLAQGLLTGTHVTGERFADADRRSRLPHFQPGAAQAIEGRLNRLRGLSRELMKTPSQVAIRWVLDQGVDVAIVGARRAAQVDENLGAMGWILSAAARSALVGNAAMQKVSE
jgi:aryl-alcohol dehydrogenase-like predicted oxidoreductase